MIQGLMRLSSSFCESISPISLYAHYNAPEISYKTYIFMLRYIVILLVFVAFAMFFFSIVILKHNSHYWFVFNLQLIHADQKAKACHRYLWSCFTSVTPNENYFNKPFFRGNVAATDCWGRIIRPLPYACNAVLGMLWCFNMKRFI